MRYTLLKKSIGILSLGLLSSGCAVPSMNLLDSGSAQYPRPTMQSKQIGLNNSQQVLSGALQQSPLYQGPISEGSWNVFSGDPTIKEFKSA